MKWTSAPFRMIVWAAISMVLVSVDYFSGPFLQFPITFLVPIALASWFEGRWIGIAYSILLPAIRFIFVTELWSVPWTWTDAAINAVIRVAVFTAFAVLIDRTAHQTRQLRKEVQMLEGLLPICSWCKKIRDAQSEWQPMEKYISERSPAEFSHGICPDCMQKHYGDLLKDDA